MMVRDDGHQGLRRDGYLEVKPDGIVRLTPKGKETAYRTALRHHLIERMLAEMFGMEWYEVHDEAERLEHAVPQPSKPSCWKGLVRREPAHTVTGCYRKARSNVVSVEWYFFPKRARIPGTRS